MLPLSKTMRMDDFAPLQEELTHIDHVLAILNGGDKAQHQLRRWEYAMAWRAFETWAYSKRSDGWERNSFGAVRFKVADHGCCTGMLAPAMFMAGCDVTLYEIWAWGNQQEYATQQMEMVRSHRLEGWTNEYKWVNRPLNQLTDEDRGFDVVFCISTLEHIVPYEEAFRDLCHCVGPHGMLFITSDSAEDEQDHYIANNVRGGRMFNKDVYERLIGWGREEGFELLGGESDYSWDASCQLVPAPNTSGGYGFACLALVRT